jgi:putative inorganic carbon (hco3(-)) transporter
LQPLTSETQERTLFVIAIAAASAIQVSIAASQILLGLGVLVLLIWRHKIELPRIWLPIALLFAWTIAADVLSPDPWGGRAQIRKFFVFLFLPLIYSVFVSRISKTYYLMLLWTVAAVGSGFWGLIQFVVKYQHARQTGENFYVTYLARRMTGFESHWMTFGALQLSVLSMLLAHWFFAKRKFPVWFYSISIAILSVAIVMGWTRSIWLAAIPSVLYLVWFWRPKMILVAPVAAALVFALAPAGTRDRLTSLVAPHGDTDSNRHRVVTFRTGIRMIEAHPWFGIGPEEISRQFNAYVPADVRRPLPVGYYGHLHNIYVQYAAERGLPGLLFVLWFIGLALVDCRRAIARAPAPSDELFLLHGAVAVTLGILVQGAFEYNLGDSEVLMMFLSVIALAYAAIRNVAVVARTQDPNVSPGSRKAVIQEASSELTGRVSLKLACACFTARIREAASRGVPKAVGFFSTPDKKMTAALRVAR